MNYDETIAKSRQLDAFLVKARKENMPITGANEVMSVKSILADAKKQLADATSEFKNNLAAELAGLAQDVRANGALVVKKVANERKEALAEFADILGNEHPGATEDVAGKPQAGAEDPAGAPATPPPVWMPGNNT